MPRRLQLCRLGLTGAATVAVHAACGGSGGADNAASSSTDRTTTADATTSAAATGSGFCDQARTLMTEVNATMDAGSEQRLGQAVPTFASQLGSVTPPPAIAADWQQAVSAVQQLAQDFQGANLSDPQQLQQLEDKTHPAEAQLVAAGRNIADYVGKQCGATG